MSSPRLTKLRWIQEVPGHTDLLTLFSPSLRSLHIIFRHPRSWRRAPDQASMDKAFVEDLLVRAAARAPYLTYLRITRTSGIPESWLVPVRRFSRVESVDLLEPAYDAVSTSALMQPLAALEHLRTLKMRLQPPPRTCPGSGVAPCGPRGFSALRELQLNGKFAGLQDATEFLRGVASPHLRSLRIEDCECGSDDFAEALLEFCTVALQAKFATSLEVVALSVYGIGAPVTLERPLVEYLHPLLQVRGLRDVRLSLAPKAVFMAVSETDVRAMADAWPLLKRLRLDCALAKSEGGAPGGGLSRRVLEWMVQTYPLLEDVQLPVDGDSEVIASASEDRLGAYVGSHPMFGYVEPVLCPCLCSA
ncbi:hypothetical protein L226DRAFT_536414 [Lentinus tigrinus ALCF2SS1-7]|nr:hypothetical protein L226DRAFT_536414 [Lentinus tigrinus ALCF2SS1-7]